MGAFVSEQGSLFKTMEKSDGIQKYYYNIFSSIYKDHGGLLSGHLIPMYYQYIASPMKEKFNDKEYKQKFLNSQLNEFGGTKWVDSIKKELSRLQ